MNPLRIVYHVDLKGFDRALYLSLAGSDRLRYVYHDLRALRKIYLVEYCGDNQFIIVTGERRIG